jgi:arylsulfatase A-like enzyme
MSPHTNVVLIVADALRADALGPLLKARFANWYRFEDCFSAAPWTLPACTSLMTGYDTRGHGHFSHRHELTRSPLTAQFGPERRKAAIVNNSVLSKVSGLAVGFDEYTVVSDHLETFERAHAFLDERARDEKPYFLFVHSNIPHDYFLPTSESYYCHAYPERADWFPLRYKVISWRNVSDSQRSTVRRVYESCTQAVDEKIDGLVARLDPATTAICFTADHGEGFDVDRGRVHHGGRVHDDVIRVPCAMYVPPSAPAAAHDGIRAAQSLPMSPPDILPTLLALAGSSAPLRSDPDTSAGRDLAEVGRAGTRRMLFAADRRYLYLANRRRLNTNAKGKHLTRRDKIRNRILRATIADDYGLYAYIDLPFKLIVTTVRARNAALSWCGSPILRKLHNGEPFLRRHGSDTIALELFDLATDPEETTNLLLTRPDLIDAVEPLLDAPFDAPARDLHLRDLVA